MRRSFSFRGMLPVTSTLFPESAVWYCAVQAQAEWGCAYSCSLGTCSILTHPVPQALKQQLSSLQDELRRREARWSNTHSRLRKQLETLSAENAALRDEVQVLEKLRVATWKKAEAEREKSTVQTSDISQASSRRSKSDVSQLVFVSLLVLILFFVCPFEWPLSVRLGRLVSLGRLLDTADISKIRLTFQYYDKLYFKEGHGIKGFLCLT